MLKQINTVLIHPHAFVIVRSIGQVKLIFLAKLMGFFVTELTLCRDLFDLELKMNFMSVAGSCIKING